MKVISLLLVILSMNTYSKCIINTENVSNEDLLSITLSNLDNCPKDVMKLKSIFKKNGLNALPSLVANRGAHNPKFGSFSIFESLKGRSLDLGLTILPEHFYFGHFTSLNSKGEVALDQVNSNRKLLIEVMAFDFKKKVYNFYELIGSSNGPMWFYRGDSFDALADNRNLKRGLSPTFGKKMRCSACHNSGGPIMKELDFPHNDWWSKSNKLSFGKNKVSGGIQKYLNEFIEASSFSSNVKTGVELLAKARTSGKLSLQEKLRPLFCTTQINLKSDNKKSNKWVQIPSSVFINYFLFKETKLNMKRSAYKSGLMSLGSKFPEINRIDADNAFLAPVKAFTDNMAIEALIKSKLIDEEFALDVLSIDFKNPLFSNKRCNLLKLIGTETPNWLEVFKKSLSMNDSEAAVGLLTNLSKSNIEIHKDEAKSFIAAKEKSWESQENVIEELKALNKLRQSVFEDEISNNPKGQILEPGFRVIFPEIK